MIAIFLGDSRLETRDSRHMAASAVGHLTTSPVAVGKLAASACASAHLNASARASAHLAASAVGQSLRNSHRKSNNNIFPCNLKTNGNLNLHFKANFGAGGLHK